MITYVRTPPNQLCDPTPLDAVGKSLRILAFSRWIADCWRL